MIPHVTRVSKTTRAFGSQSSVEYLGALRNVFYNTQEKALHALKLKLFTGTPSGGDLHELLSGHGLQLIETIIYMF